MDEWVDGLYGALDPVLDPLISPIEGALLAVGWRANPHREPYVADSALRATWFISPRRHALEMVTVVPLVLLITFIVSKTCKRRQKNSPAACQPYPVWITLVYGVTCIGTFYYKFHPAKSFGAFVYSCMPCHIYNLMAFLATVTESTKWRRRILSGMLAMQSLPIYATFIPDTRGLELVGEVGFYYWQHFAAVAFPLHALATGRVHPIDNIRYSFFAWSCGTFFYFIPAVFIGAHFGWNLNFMMSPPAGFEQIGHNYRVYMTLLMLIAFLVGRVIAQLCSRTIRIGVKLPDPVLTDDEAEEDDPDPQVMHAHRD